MCIYHIMMLDVVPPEEMKRRLKVVNEHLRHHPDDLMVGAKKGMLLACLGRVKEGYRCMDQVEKDARRKNDTQALEIVYTNRGTYLLWQKRLKESFRHFKKALKQNPNNGQTHFLIGSVLNEMQKFGDAMPYLDQAIQLQYSDPNVYCQKAWALSGVEEHMDALRYLKKTLHKYPESAEVFCMMGDIYKKLKKFKTSVRCYKRAIRAEPNSELAHMSLVDLFMLLEKISLARRYLDKALVFTPKDQNKLMLQAMLKELESQLPPAK